MLLASPKRESPFLSFEMCEENTACFESKPVGDMMLILCCMLVADRRMSRIISFGLRALRASKWQRQILILAAISAFQSTDHIVICSLNVQVGSRFLLHLRAF